MKALPRTFPIIEQSKTSNPSAHRPEGKNAIWSLLRESQLLGFLQHFSPRRHHALCFPQAFFSYYFFPMFNHPHCFKAVHGLLLNLSSLHYQ